MEQETQVAETTPPPSLSLQDLVLLLNVVRVAAERGAIKAEEMSAVGTVYEKLVTFLTASGAINNQPAQSANAPPMTAPLAAFSTILKPFQFIQSIASFSQQDPVHSSTKYPTPPLSTGTLPPLQWEANILLASLQSALTIFATLIDIMLLSMLFTCLPSLTF